MRGDFKNHYLWLDVETTGLIDGVHKVLEIAWFFSYGTEKATGTRSYVVHHPDLARGDFQDDTVWEMHQRNGLYEESVVSETGSVWIWRKLLSEVEMYDEKTIRLAGSSVGFDRRFLRGDHQLSAAVVDRLHYRMMDVSALRMAEEDRIGWELPSPPRAHRAKADIEWSFAEYCRLIATWRPI